jgi:hypothetical protein
MTPRPESRANSFMEGLRQRWNAISMTLVGDLLATALAIGGMCLLFLACAFAALGLTHVAAFALRHLGGG